MSSNNKYFADLGLAPGASQAQIRAAYLRLAKAHHPDKKGDDKDAADFRRVHEAYEKLYDATARAEEEQRTQEPAPAPEPEAEPKEQQRPRPFNIFTNLQPVGTEFEEEEPEFARKNDKKNQAFGSGVPRFRTREERE